MKVQVSLSTSASSDAEFSKFLGSFGVPRIKHNKPISKEHFPQALRDTDEMRDAWSIFIRDTKLGRIDRLEYNSAVVSAFVKELKKAGGRPWKPGRSVKIDVFYTNLLRSRIRHATSILKEQIRAKGLVQYFTSTVGNSSSVGVMQDSMFTELEASGSFVFKTKRGLHINAVMPSLRGTLYRGSVPPRLDNSRRLKSVQGLQSEQTTSQWQHICNIDGVELKASLASSGELVVRYRVSIPGFFLIKDTRDGNNKLFSKEWKSFRP
jgi:hypothetical protein